MEERRLLETRRGRIAVGWLIVEDLACVLALVLMPVVASVLGTSGEKAITFGDVVVKILTTLIQLGLFVGVMLVVGRRLIPWLLEHTAGTGSRELFTLARSEEHTSELQSLMRISYAVFRLKKNRSHHHLEQLTSYT